MIGLKHLAVCEWAMVLGVVNVSLGVFYLSRHMLSIALLIRLAKNQRQLPNLLK